MIAKTSEEIELLRRSGDLVSRTLAEVGKQVRPGISTWELDTVAETFIRDHHGIPGFKGYAGYPATLLSSDALTATFNTGGMIALQPFVK